MRGNVNTPHYWDDRFASGDWESGGYRTQTASFAKAQVRRMRLPRTFAGTLLDFGCALGDAIPVYKEAFPRAVLIGVDISPSAVEQCRERYGHLASFVVGGIESVPLVDVIVASNVLEHLDDHLGVARALLARCKHLFITVPYMEQPLYFEHVNRYERGSFDVLGDVQHRVFACQGWSKLGLRQRWYRIHLRNLARLLLGKPLAHDRRQIIYHLTYQRPAGGDHFGCYHVGFETGETKEVGGAGGDR